MPDALQSILPPMRAAMQRYEMIRPGDRVAVGVSGGKDSLVLLAGLAAMRRFYPFSFSLTALTLDPCFEGKETDYSPVAALCDAWDVPYVVKRTRLWEVVFEQRKEANPCSLCARMRRGALHLLAQETGCGVVALGHHQDDAAETLLMNLLAGGAVSCFSPKAYLSRRGLWIIRPLVFTGEAKIAAAAHRAGLPVIPSRCPIDGVTHRQRTKQLIENLSGQYGPLAQRLTDALQKGHISGW